MRKDEKYTIVRAFAKEYRKAGKKERGRILKEVIKITGYYKTHACELLDNPPKKKAVIKRYRPSRYLEILPQLKRLWVTSNFSCGKILVPAIPKLLESLLRFKEIKVSSLEKKLLLKISAATVDRLLKPQLIPKQHQYTL